MALENLLKCPSYRLFIAIHLGSIDAGKADPESDEDFCDCISGSKGRAGAKRLGIRRPLLRVVVVVMGAMEELVGFNQRVRRPPRCLASHLILLCCSTALVPALTTMIRGTYAQYCNGIFRIFRIFYL